MCIGLHLQTRNSLKRRRLWGLVWVQLVLHGSLTPGVIRHHALDLDLVPPVLCKHCYQRKPIINLSRFAAKLDAPLMPLSFFRSSALFQFFNECNQSSNLRGKQAMNWVKSYAILVEWFRGRWTTSAVELLHTAAAAPSNSLTLCKNVALTPVTHSHSAGTLGIVLQILECDCTTLVPGPITSRWKNEPAAFWNVLGNSGVEFPSTGGVTVNWSGCSFTSFERH